MRGAGIQAQGSVLRHVVPKAVLETDPRVRGLLDPPSGGTLPANVSVRTDPSGVRVVSVNIHMATPGQLALDPRNEQVLALRDVARFVNSTDADVVLVQEVRDRPTAAALQRGGIGDQASILAHLLRADDMAFTPAITQDPLETAHRFYGTAIYTRNGFWINDAFNARLPTSSPDVELRSVGVADIHPPDGRAPFTVMGTHLANRVVEDQPLRDAQLGAIVRLDAMLRGSGRASFVDALDGRSLVAEGFTRWRRVVGGDHNQLQAASDAVLAPAGLRHVNDLLAQTGEAGRRRAALASVATASVGSPGAHRIDHMHARGFAVTDSAVADVPRHELPLDATDHRTLVVDLR